MRRNAGRAFSRYKKKKGSVKALKKPPLEVGRYKALAPAYDSSTGRVVYAVRYGSKTKKFFTAENQALFMLRRLKESETNRKEHDYLYDMFEKQAKEKEKAKKARESKRKKKKKNPSSQEEEFMEFLRNPFDEIFEDDYDIVPNPRRRR